nr:alkaline phosphatase family protein [Ardenticatena sp.]
MTSHLVIRHIVLVFLDGVGLAPAHEYNPFAHTPLPHLQHLLGDRFSLTPDITPNDTGRIATFGDTHLIALDARLGVEGIPQSGTGTTTLLTGKNAALHLGRHAGPFPPTSLRPLLATHNIFTRLRHMGHRVAFANAFPPFYLERVARGRARRTTMTQAALAAGLSLRSLEEMLRGEALSAFMTNHHWHAAHPAIPLLTPEEAGQRLAALARQATFTAFEHFTTDHLGHRRDITAAREHVAMLDAFLAAILAQSHDDTMVLIVSDHGNFEDLSTKQHTLNPALCLVKGSLPLEPHSLTDIVPLILHALHHVTAPNERT